MAGASLRGRGLFSLCVLFVGALMWPAARGVTQAQADPHLRAVHWRPAAAAELGHGRQHAGVGLPDRPEPCDLGLGQLAHLAVVIDQTLAHRLAPPVDLPSAVRQRVATIRQERV